jgi:methionyl-tRNA formyltransferase
MRVVFLGSGPIGLPALRWLAECGKNEGYSLIGVVTQPDRPVGRGLQLLPGPIKEFARNLGVPILQPERLRESRAVADLAELKGDLFVVVAYGQILSREVLALPKMGVINLHASLLPRHRGASPIQAAILSGDEVSGMTVMHVVPELDAGDIILQKRIQLLPDETGGSLHDRLAELGAPALAEAMSLLAAGTASRTAQDSALVTYSGKLSKDSGRLNWSLAAEQLERQVRAFNPWPGSFSVLANAEQQPELVSVKIWRARVVGGRPGLQPGAILPSGEGRLVVACGEGALEILEAQLAGRKRLPVRDLLRGWKIAEGAKFVL